MEFDLVEDSVKVVEIQEAFQNTLEYEELISKFEGGSDGEPRKKLFLKDIPVALNSFREFCDESFGADVNQFLKGEEQRFADLKLEIILFNGYGEYTTKYGELDECLNGYVLLSGMETPVPDEQTVNIIERLEHAFGENEVHFDIELSLAHLPNRRSRVALDSVITLKASNLTYSSLSQRIGGEFDRIPMAMSNLSNLETGYIRGKLSVEVNVDDDAYNFFLKFGRIPKSFDNLYRNMNELGQPTDLEIRCKNGAVVKCHSALLTGNAWQKKLENDLRESGARPLTLDMEMSEEGVKAFLEWNHSQQVPKAAGEKSEVALELLKAGRQYEVKELETEMEKLLMSKGTKNLDYFSAEGALRLYLYVKDDTRLTGDLKEKAVRVLKNYIRYTSKLEESVEYQNFFRNDLQEAMKLAHLYARF